MDKEAGFPTFECVLSGTIEDLDSVVERFFWQKNHLAVALARLRIKDTAWSEKYEKMMRYLSDLSNSLVNFTEPPSHKFLVDLSLGEEIEDDTVVRLLGTREERTIDLTDAAIMVSELMHWYVRLSKIEKFRKGFPYEKFQGLPFLRLALVYRAIRLSRMSRT